MQGSSVGGVYPSQWIRAAIEHGFICGEPPISPAQVQPNSLDLRVGARGCRVQCSFLPGDEGLQNKLARFKWYEFDVPADGVVLERNQAYIFPLMERLALPDDVYARANPKSSTGRLDVFTRLVTEFGDRFDQADPGYHGQLYLEVVPRSFAIRVRAGDALAQIRFQTGRPQLGSVETVSILDGEDILFGPSMNVLRSSDIQVDPGLLLSVSLPRRNEPLVGYVARRNTPPIDLRAIGEAKITYYWDRIHGGSKPIILEPDEFYIFASRELIRLPPAYCAEMVAFDASSGEVRTHYAGFFDSGFGYSAGRSAVETAAAVVLEVRSRDVPFLIEDGQPLFRVHLMRNTEEPALLYGAQLSSNYQSQRLRLSKQFTNTTDFDDGSRSGQSRMEFS